MRGRKSTLVRALGAGLMATAVGVAVPMVMSAPAGATAPSPPFNECPAIGSNTSCSILIVVNQDGSVSVYADNSAGGPYDGVEDTLVGVLNNSPNPLPSLQLGSSTQDIFGFDGDGICTYSTVAGQTGYTGDTYCSSADAQGTDPGDYRGPDNTLAAIDSMHGSVAFTDTPSGLPSGGTSYFSLEEQLSASDITTPPPTSLSVTGASATTSDFNDPVIVAATLLDNSAAAISGATVNFYLGTGGSAPTCQGTTDGSGTASCAITPNQAAGATTLYATYGGDLTHLGSSTNAPFTVTLEQDAISYTGATSATNGSPLTLSSKLTSDDPSAGTAVSGRTLSMSLGGGSSAQSCSGTTDSSGTASCSISAVNQSAGSVPVSATFTSDGYYVTVATSGSVNVVAVATTPAQSTPAQSPPPAKAIPAATTVHTGEPFAGSKGLVLAALGTGAGLIGLGLRRRRLAAR